MQSLDDALKPWLGLSLIHGIGAHTYCQLLQHFGNPANIYAAPYSKLCQVVSAEIATEINKGLDEEAVAPALAWLKLADNNHIITLADECYPKALLEINDPPPLLYAKGDLRLLNTPCLAIVGSRNATPQGEKNATDFAKSLCEHGLTIVSGMALGIDGAAHQGALKANGATIAVVGTGLDIVYPAKHRNLAHQIVEHGLMLSEFALGTPSKAQNFPRRNRLISGLSLGCLVVEANLQSGSLITARLAGEQGREVFAIPSSIHSPQAKGCHYLIKQGAKLVDDMRDILSELNFEIPPQAIENMAETAQGLLAHISFDAISIESLGELAGLNSSALAGELMVLELAGKIAKMPGGMVQRLQ